MLKFFDDNAGPISSASYLLAIAFLFGYRSSGFFELGLIAISFSSAGTVAIWLCPMSSAWRWMAGIAAALMAVVAIVIELGG